MNYSLTQSTTGELEDVSTGRGGELREGFELGFQEGSSSSRQ